jgi:hypothetical protein
MYSGAAVGPEALAVNPWLYVALVLLTCGVRRPHRAVLRYGDKKNAAQGRQPPPQNPTLQVPLRLQHLSDAWAQLTQPHEFCLYTEMLKPGVGCECTSEQQGVPRQMQGGKDLLGLRTTTRVDGSAFRWYASLQKF